MPLEFTPDTMPLEFTPDTDLFSVMAPLFGEADGFDGEGLDADGYNREGFRPDDQGIPRDRDGYDEDGFKPDANGVERDRHGYDVDGFKPDANSFGVERDRRGFDRDGYNEDGYDAEGFNEDGFDLDGYDRNGFDDEGYDEDGYDTEGDHRSDRDYEERDRDTSWLGGNPKFVFYSTPAEKVQAEVEGRYQQGKRLTGVPYFGMEIELTSDCNSEVREIVQNRYGHIVWGKVDCSVEGFEMCTHPMTAAWAQENFPWQIVEELGMAGCEVWTESNGLHIHVSRDGFNGWAHQYRWVKFFYSIQDQIKGREGMAGRSAGEWGKFDSRDRKNHLDTFLTQMNRERGGSRDYKDYLARYSALNLQNKRTIEARIFTSTTDPEVLRMRFELMASTVEYTRGLTVPDIRNGGWEYNTFVQWLIKNEGAYPALERRVVVPSRTLS